MKFDHSHYVPILKTKLGERWALQNLDAVSKSKITPVLEVHRHKDNPPDVHCESICESLVDDWGTSGGFFLDTVWLHSVAGVPAVIRSAFASARNHGLQAIPVARTSYSAQTLAAIRDIASEDGRGCMLRLESSDLDRPQVIEATVAATGLNRRKIHLLLDYREQPMSLAVDVPRVPNLTDWRTFIAASGVAPLSLSALDSVGQRVYPLNFWNQIPRRCWTSWRQGIQSNIVVRKPAFSDFATRHPGRPAEGGRPSVELRYTADGYWLAWIGGKVAAGASPAMKAVCASLMLRQEYLACGAQYSAGDGAIYQCAQPSSGPGSAAQWVRWGISHHLVFVAARV